MAKKQQLLDKRFELYERAHTKEYYAVAKWLSEVKFQPAVFGVDQADVWRKIEKLCELYEAALDAERARNAKLERKLRSVSSGKAVESKETRVTTKAAPAKTEIRETPVEAVKLASAGEKGGLTESVPVSVEKEKQTQLPLNPVEIPAKPSKQEKSTSSDEDILQELLKEFGPKGGEPNG